MKIKQTLLGLILLAAMAFLNACGDSSCPDGMVEQKLQDGSTICVPEWFKNLTSLRANSDERGMTACPDFIGNKSPDQTAE